MYGTCAELYLVHSAKASCKLMVTQHNIPAVISARRKALTNYETCENLSGDCYIEQGFHKGLDGHIIDRVNFSRYDLAVRWFTQHWNHWPRIFSPFVRSEFTSEGCHFLHLKLYLRIQKCLFSGVPEQAFSSKESRLFLAYVQRAGLFFFCLRR